MQFMKSQFCRRIAMALGLVLAAAVPGQAGLIIDLQATSAVGATLTNAKLIENATVGAVINFNVVALITGQNANPNDDGIVSMAGSFLTSNAGPIKANVGGVLRNTLHNAAGSNNGLQADLDGDGDFDWGSNADNLSTGFFSTRADTSPEATLGASQIIGTLSLTVTEANAGSITFNFRKRLSDTAAAWREDGTDGQEGTIGYISGAGLSPNFGPGAPVTISAAVIPEPSTLALGGIALVGFAGMQLRRRKAN